MSLWMVVPVRSLRDGKRRLAPALDDVQRASLVEWFLAHTLEQAAEFPGLTRTLVVTACKDARAFAINRGARVLEESGPGGLNSALRQAQSTVVSLGGSQMLVVSCDLPLLRSDDLRRCAIAASKTTFALAPDRTRQGTNGICLPTLRAFDFSFGPNSFARHRERVQNLGLESVTIESPGLAFDVDLPVHLAEIDTLLSGLLRRSPHDR